jgi:hypothetical protein
MLHDIQHAFGAFRSSLSVQCRKKSWVAYVCNQQFSGDDIIDIGRRQTLQKESNAGINKVLAMRPGLAQITGKVGISNIFASAEPDLHMAENACHLDYVDTWSAKQVHLPSRSQSAN